MQRAIWLLLLVLAVALGVQMARDNGTVMGLSGVDLAAVFVWVGFTVVAAAAAVRLFRGRIAAAIQSALIWLLIAASIPGSPLSR